MGPKASPHHHFITLFQSTHLLRGGTYAVPRRAVMEAYFNPPTSCEVGPSDTTCHIARCTGFQSTHLLRGGTRRVDQPHGPSVFQSTHLLRGGTCSLRFTPVPFRYFNPPTSCEVGRRLPHLTTGVRYFNPPTSCEVGPTTRHSLSTLTNFNPPTSCEVGPDTPVSADARS